ncbi:MAG: molybdopterin-dependent oxidoreductase, partial [Ilumatobacteraceae bacterium]
MTTRTSFRTCGLCEATCGLRLTTEADVVLSVQGDEDDVFSSGYICPKAGALGQLHADPDRLHEPHRRDRASGAWTGTTWDHALGEIGTRLRSTIHSHGPDSVAVYMGNGLTHGATGALYAPALLRALGSRRIFSSSTLDVMPRWLASGLLYGTSTSVPVPDVDRCHTLVVIGANPLVSNGSVWTAPNLGNRLRALKRRGGALVVVDPARTRTARLADEHISIRPGTDVLLLLSIAHVLFALDLVDTGHVPIRAGDLERLRQLLQPFTPSAVAPATGVEVETIQGLAQRIAAAPSAAVYGRLGIHATRWGTLAAWATDVVTVLTGNLDRVGGMMFPKPAHSRPSPSRPRRFRTGRYRSRVSGYPEVNGELPAVALREEIEDDGPDRIRALIVLGANPVLTVPNGRGLRRALSRLDLMVSVDMYAYESSALGDDVLPVASRLERSTFEWGFLGVAIRMV